MDDVIKTIAQDPNLQYSSDGHASKWIKYASDTQMALIGYMKLNIHAACTNISKNRENNKSEIVTLEERKEAIETLRTYENYDNRDWLMEIDYQAVSCLPEKIRSMLLNEEWSVIYNDSQWAHCLKLFLSGQWKKIQHPSLHLTLGAVLIGWFHRLSTRLNKPTSQELELYLKVESLLYQLVADEMLSEMIDRVQKQSGKKVANSSKKDTTDKNQVPVIKFIKKKYLEGAFKDCGGKDPGHLAGKINTLIVLHNAEVRSKGTNQELHPYSKDQLKRMLFKNFEVKKGEKLPKPLTLCSCEK